MRLKNKVLLTTGLAAAVAVGISAPSALAKGPRSTSTATYSDFSLVVASGAAAQSTADQVAHYGDQVTFNVSTDAYQPHVDLVCSQAGTKVYGHTTGYYASYPFPSTQLMTLSSQAWTGGAADCTATLYYWDGRHTTVLETLNFAVSA